MEKYQPPSWAGSPDAGMHLDVMKDGKVVEKIPIDEKPYYLFGRNVDMVDIVAEHASCSRVHAALIFHKSLKDRAFLMDLGSAHGTFIGHLQLEPQAAKPLQFRQEFRLGASTRTYAVKSRNDFEQQSSAGSAAVGSDLLNVIPPQASEAEIQAMTSYNTQQNMQLAKPREDDVEQWSLRKQQHPRSHQSTHRKRPLLLSPPSMINADGRVNFKDQDEIINPEDIDPTVGKFRDMVRVEVISRPSHASNAAKRRRLMQDFGFGSTSVPVKQQAISRTSPFYMPSKVGLSATESSSDDAARGLYSNLSSSTLLPVPNLTPEVSFGSSSPMNVDSNRRGSADSETSTNMEDPFQLLPSQRSRGVLWPSAPEPASAEPMDTSPYNAPFGTPAVVQHAPVNLHSDAPTSSEAHAGGEDSAKKKRYAKEVWPGKAPDPMPHDEDVSINSS